MILGWAWALRIQPATLKQIAPSNCSIRDHHLLRAELFRMSSQAETKQVLPVPSATLEKVIHVPLIADGLSYVHSVIEAHPLLKRTYSLGESVVPKVIDLVKPVASLFATPLKIVDGMALKVLNFAEAKFPYPFHVTGRELASQVQKPVDQTRDVVQGYTDAAHKAYDERIVAPARSIYEQMGDRIEGLQNQDNVYLQKAATTVVSTYKQLLQLAQDWGKKAEHDTAEGEQKAEGVLKRLNTEVCAMRGIYCGTDAWHQLENLHKFATSLPAESQKRLEPLLNTLQDTCTCTSDASFD